MATREQDPAQQGQNRKEAQRKLEQIKREISLIADDWVIDAANNQADSSILEELLLFAFLFGGNFYLDQNIERAFRSGVLGADRDAQRVLRQMLDSGQINFMFDINNVFFSADYQQALQTLKEINQTAIEGHIKQYAGQIAALVLLGLTTDNKPIAEIQKDVQDRVDALFGKVSNAANTGIQRSASDGAIFATILMATALGQEALVKHKSALLPTTRPHHAARHNNVYTVTQQRNWWASGSNRYNCYCHVEPYFKRKKP